uniref:Uncharacterized protein n=1 Tax=Romanomermis culicivorax TaxID=13658 RepID=A0A915I3H2_ROMCU
MIWHPLAEISESSSPMIYKATAMIKISIMSGYSIYGMNNTVDDMGFPKLDQAAGILKTNPRRGNQTHNNRNDECVLKSFHSRRESSSKTQKET